MDRSEWNVEFCNRVKKVESDRHYLVASKLLTVGWGIFAIVFAQYANRLGTLVEAVNILGTFFYGIILGIFIVSFYLKSVRGAATFYTAILAEVGVVYCFLFTDISFLWYNVVGCLLVVFFLIPINRFLQKRKKSYPEVLLQLSLVIGLVMPGFSLKHQTPDQSQFFKKNGLTFQRFFSILIMP